MLPLLALSGGRVRGASLFSSYILRRLHTSSNCTADSFLPFPDCATPLGSDPPVPLHKREMAPIDRRIGFMGSGQVSGWCGAGLGICLSGARDGGTRRGGLRAACCTAAAAAHGRGSGRAAGLSPPRLVPTHQAVGRALSLLVHGEGSSRARAGTTLPGPHPRPPPPSPAKSHPAAPPDDAPGTHPSSPRRSLPPLDG
jgi:hypothetical protein